MAQRRTGEEFYSKLLTFGCKVTYRLPGDIRKDGLKFEEPTDDAIFMGWQIDPGAKFRGDYWILDLDSYMDNPEQAVPRRIKEIFELQDREFPLADAKQQAQRERLL